MKKEDKLKEKLCKIIEMPYSEKLDTYYVSHAATNNYFVSYEEAERSSGGGTRDAWPGDIRGVYRPVTKRQKMLERADIKNLYGYSTGNSFFDYAKENTDFLNENPTLSLTEEQLSSPFTLHINENYKIETTVKQALLSKPEEVLKYLSLENILPYKGEKLVNYRPIISINAIKKTIRRKFDEKLKEKLQGKER